ncbi:MAG: hypothetical protein KatS3mg090_0880 [Patescibacteria group bacterium]|nr:MAG: hypothetical protein KatS3mg090_0880 [Patescibacteria group bacterium]
MFLFAKKDTYLSLFLTENNLIVSYIDPKNSNRILKEFRSSIEDTAELASYLESVLDEIKENFKDRPNKIVFFLTSFFIDKDSSKIKKVYLKEFSDICKKLSLKILGYIETQEAIVKKFLQSGQKTAVFVEIDSSRAFANLIENNKVSYSVFNLFVADKLTNVKDSVVNVLPDQPKLDKIIIADYLDLPKLDQDLVELDWQNVLKLNDKPEVEMVKFDQLNQILVDLFCAEITGSNLASSSQEDPEVFEKTSYSYTAESTVTENQSEADNYEYSAPNLPFGFSETDDINTDYKKETEQDYINLNFEEQRADSLQTNTRNRFWSGLSLSMFRLKLPDFRVKGPVFAIIIFVLGFLVVFFVNELYFHRLVISVEPQTSEIKVEQSLTADELNDLIAYETKTFSLTDKTATSGTESVGEKAKGEITVYNFSTQQFSLDKGSKISINGKVFVTDLALKLDPAEETEVDGSVVKKPAVGTVGITAEQIGSDYNLSYSDKIKLGDLNTDLYYAKLTKATSGGSQEELSTVAKSDLDKLKESVLEKTKEQLSSEELSFDKTKYFYISDLNQYQITKAEFDKEVNEVADSVSVSAEVEAKLALLDKEKVLKLIEPKLQSQLETNFKYASDDLEITYKKESSDDTVKYNFAITANTRYNLDKSRLSALVVWKPKTEVVDLLKKEPGVANVAIIEDKTLIPFLSYTPVFADKIVIE